MTPPEDEDEALNSRMNFSSAAGSTPGHGMFLGVADKVANTIHLESDFFLLSICIRAIHTECGSKADEYNNLFHLITLYNIYIYIIMYRLT